MFLLKALLVVLVSLTWVTHEEVAAFGLISSSTGAKRKSFQSSSQRRIKSSLLFFSDSSPLSQNGGRGKSKRAEMFVGMTATTIAQNEEPDLLHKVTVAGINTIYLSCILVGGLALKGMDVSKAIAWGHVPLLLLVLKQYSQYKKVVNTKLITFFSYVNAILAGSLLLNLFSSPTTAAKVAGWGSIVLGSMGVMVYATPTFGGKVLLGIDLDKTNAKSKAIIRVLGQARTVSTALNSMLAFGVTPINAFGLSLALFTITMFEMIFFSGTFNKLE